MERTGRMRARTVILAAVLAALLGGSTSVQAKIGSPRRDCVVWIAPADAGGHSKLSGLHCFRDQAAATRFARGPAPSGFQADTGEIAASSTRISIDYDASGFTGTTLTWTVSNTSGCNGFTYSAASMPS